MNRFALDADRLAAKLLLACNDAASSRTPVVSSGTECECTKGGVVSNTSPSLLTLAVVEVAVPLPLLMVDLADATLALLPLSCCRS